MNTKTVQARLAKRLLCIVCAVAGGCGDSTTLHYDPQPPDAPAPTLSVTPDTLVFDAEGGTLVLNLATTTAEWKIESPSEWLTIKVESSDGSPHGSLGGGAGNFSIRISATSNETDARRTASIRVSGNDAGTVTIPVEQKAFGESHTPSLSVEPSSLTFKADGESFDLVVTTDAAAWTATCKAAWITITSDNDATLRATAMPNRTASPRSATILFTGEDADPFESLRDTGGTLRIVFTALHPRTRRTPFARRRERDLLCRRPTAEYAAAAATESLRRPCAA
ncbi:MAG: BACON domain-containing protein [Alistipes communis]